MGRCQTGSFQHMLDVFESLCSLFGYPTRNKFTRSRVYRQLT
ncbi:hypothetical protein EVA_07997 [gut metagenome]|uniref:Uncharacterized protein n=1 Tax=gut metagenome TaxID=749906 RepID=J9GNK5_9ZZZZ